MFRRQDFRRKEKVMLFRKMEYVKQFEKIAFELGVILSATERDVFEKCDFSDTEVRGILLWEFEKENKRKENYKRRVENDISRGKRETLDEKLDKLY